MLKFQIDKHVRTYPDGETKEWYQAYFLPRRWWNGTLGVSQGGILFDLTISGELLHIPDLEAAMKACCTAAEGILKDDRYKNSKVVVSSVPYVYLDGKLYTEAEAEAKKRQENKV